MQQLVERQVDEQLSHWLSQQIIERDGEDLATVASLVRIAHGKRKNYSSTQ